MSGGGQTTSTTKTDPWAGQQPYLTYGFQQAQDQFKSGTPSYYPSSTVAPQSGNTQSAYNMVSNQVNNNPLQGASSNQVQNTLNGNYLNGNPYMDAQFQAGTRQIGNTYNDLVGGQTSNFSGAGRYGSGMQGFMQNRANQTLGDNLNNLYANTYGQNYQNERANQVNAVGQAAGVQNQGLTNANALGSVGSAQDQYAQNLTDANVNKWNFDQQLPQNKLTNYMNMVQGNFGGTSATTTPTNSNPWSTIMGLGAMGAGAFMHSDRRLKFDITPVGKADNGLTIYSYRYHALPERVMLGFMADEVREVHPDAVSASPEGYLMVDYEKASRPLEAA